MNNCDLDKLTCNSGVLNPKFKKNITEYYLVVKSTVAKVGLDWLTSDSGATCQIVGNEGSRSLDLDEGIVKDAKLECTAEDGTIKHYIVRIKRVSSSDCSLVDIKLNEGALEPAFAAGSYNYSDKAASFQIPDCENGIIQLSNPSNTKIEVKVTAANKNDTQTYEIIACKSQFPRYLQLDSKDLINFECPVSLSVLHGPIVLKEDGATYKFSWSTLEEFTRTSKINPFTGRQLSENWRECDYDMEKDLAVLNVKIPLTNGEVLGPFPLHQVEEQAANISKTLPQPDVKYEASSKFKPTKPDVRTWEKDLLKVYESDYNVLEEMMNKAIADYFNEITGSSITNNNAGEKVLELLNEAIYCAAAMIKAKGTKSDLHLKLAMLLEEKMFIEDNYGLGKKSTDDVDYTGFQGAKESSKQEECEAICEQRGGGKKAPIATQLKKVDEEYHHLLNSGQSGKADHVQALYAWLAKKATLDGVKVKKLTDEADLVDQTFLKYQDALFLDDAKATNYFHTGRLLLKLERFDEAAACFTTALSWNNKYEYARFYLGIAKACDKGLLAASRNDVIAYLVEGLEMLLQHNEQASSNKTANKTLLAENLLRNTNLTMLRGVFTLGKLLSEENQKPNTITATNVLHNVCLLCSQALVKTPRGKNYQDIEWILLQSHSLLLDILLKETTQNKPLITKRCDALSALLNRSTLDSTLQMLDLKLKTYERLVKLTPSDSRALFHLGQAQFDLSERVSGNVEHLDNAEKSFLAAIELEGKPDNSPPLELITKQSWWNPSAKAETSKAAAPTKGGTAAPAKAGPAGKGNAAAVSKATAAKKTTPAPAKGPPPKQAAAAKTAAKPGVKAAPAPKPAAKKIQTPKCSHGNAAQSEVSPLSPSTETAKPDAATPQSPGPLNKKSHFPYLGLARIYAAKKDDRAPKYYKDVIALAPQYASLMVIQEPMAAVEIYCTFPMPEEVNFDDAFICGEVVRILMKQEQFDDSRLEKHMILLGRAMGIATLEKYIAILDNKFKTDLLMKIYAGVNKKSVDDPEMQQFFKFKCWV